MYNISRTFSRHYMRFFFKAIRKSKAFHMALLHEIRSLVIELSTKDFRRLKVQDLSARLMKVISLCLCIYHVLQYVPTDLLGHSMTIYVVSIISIVKHIKRAYLIQLSRIVLLCYLQKWLKIMLIKISIHFYSALMYLFFFFFKKKL